MVKKKQSRLLTGKIIVLFALLAVCMFVLAFILSGMQTDLYLQSYVDEMADVFEELPDRIESANAEADRNRDTFDDTYQSLAQSISFMAQNDAGFARDKEKMEEYQELFGVNNVLLVKKDGTVITQAAPTLADFSSSRFNQLRTVFDDGEPSEAVDVEDETQDWLMRYYSACIDDDTMVVIEMDPTEMRSMIDFNSSSQSILQDLDVGQSGFFFAVSAKDYHIDYYPDSSMINKDALDAGLEVAKLEDGMYSWMNLNGVTLYCGVRKFDDMYYIAAVPQSDMTSARNTTVAVILAVFLLMMIIIIMYGIFVLRERERKGSDPEDMRQIGMFRFGISSIRRSAVLSLCGLLAIVVVSYYMQTLFALSSTSVSNNKHVSDVVETLESTNARMNELSEEYSERYLPMCKTVGYILDSNGDLINQRDLQTLASILNVHSIFVYNSNARLMATNSSYTNHELSLEPEDSSYEFIKVLQDIAEYVVQEPERDEITGDYWQYIGVPLHDADGYVDGLVQIAIRPTLLENVMATADLDTVLSSVRVGTDDFAFAVNKEDNTFAYYPKNEVYVGESVLSHGISEEQIKDNFHDYITIDGEKYFAASAETEEYYIYLVGTEGELMNERVPLTAVTGVAALIYLLIFILIFIFEPKRFEEQETEQGDPSDRTIDVEMPGGRVVQTESASTRWLNRTYSWGEQTAWQKTVTVMRWIIAVLMVVIGVAVLFKERLFDESSIFYYILSNEWEHGLNIFAITASIMFLCVALTAVAIFRRLIHMISSVLSARGETVCRLLTSFVQYGTVIGMTYYCLLLIGIDGTTLLASAGILSVAVSLGARELIEDIISGLFIIFEGEFRVGDIIMVGDWRGTVLEIGVRTTKVEDPAQNVKVIRNSDVNNVINMTKKLSFVSCDFSIEYGESLERVESILAKELPLLPERLPAIQVGPFYRGVTALSDSSVDIRISMQCAEADRMQLARDVNREIKLIFDKYDINIPFPQIVVNQPPEFKQATVSEKEEAQQFAQNQKNATKDFGEEYNYEGNGN